jgi:hypothetical protein
LIACPVCNDTTIGRVPSKFAIKSSQGFTPRVCAARAPDVGPAH